MDMPQPTPSHKKLERLAGDWHGEETMFPSPWDPAGGVYQARLNSRVAIDGFAVIGDYEQSRNGQVTFRGHGVHTIDPQTGENLLYWFDSMGQGANLFRGGFESDALILTEANPRGYNRMTYTASGDGRLYARMEMSPDGQNWNALFEGVYSKE